jgi:putative hydrolase of the HAD superfamily
LAKTAIGPWFDRIICAGEVGAAKEDLAFWDRLRAMLNYDPKRTLLVDDTEKVLFTAREHGLGYLLFVARPSSRQRVQYSCNFPSIEYFKELLPR